MLRRMLLTIFGGRDQMGLLIQWPMTRSRSAPLLRLPWYMLTLAAPGSHRKLGNNGRVHVRKQSNPGRLVREELGE